MVFIRIFHGPSIRTPTVYQLTHFKIPPSFSAQTLKPHCNCHHNLFRLIEFNLSVFLVPHPAISLRLSSSPFLSPRSRQQNNFTVPSLTDQNTPFPTLLQRSLFEFYLAQLQLYHRSIVPILSLRIIATDINLLRLPFGY